MGVELDVVSLVIIVCSYWIVHMRRDSPASLLFFVIQYSGPCGS